MTTHWGGLFFWTWLASQSPPASCRACRVWRELTVWVIVALDLSGASEDPVMADLSGGTVRHGRQRRASAGRPIAAGGQVVVRPCRVEAPPSRDATRDRRSFAGDRTAGAGRPVSDCLGGRAVGLREDDLAGAVGRAQRTGVRVGVGRGAGQRSEGPAQLYRGSARCGRADRRAGVRRTRLPGEFGAWLGCPEAGGGVLVDDFAGGACAG